MSANFADYIHYWKHNGYWLFDSPEVIRNVARENSISLDDKSLFFYEAHENEFDGENWHAYRREPSLPTQIVIPPSSKLEGFDIATFMAGNSPEHSPLSCNSLAEELPTNAHCLLASFEEAQVQLAKGAFKNSEPGSYRIFAVYSVAWPSPSSLKVTVSESA